MRDRVTAEDFVSARGRSVQRVLEVAIMDVDLVFVVLILSWNRCAIKLKSMKVQR